MKKEEKFSYQKLFPLLIIIATCFMGIGYASINSITFDIEGEILAVDQNGIFITDVIYKQSTSTEEKESVINPSYGTNLNSNIFLSEDNTKSTITYTVNFFNDYSEDYIYLETRYDTEAYDNEDITYTVKMPEGRIIKSKDDLNLEITFNYTNGLTNIDDNTLSSIINFYFIKRTERYEFTGSSQTFITQLSGNYKIELWGAGGEVYELVHSETVGKGAYVSGELFLEKDLNLFIYVGDVENFNGGGIGEAGGGGATDIRLVNGDWDNFESLKFRIMVAAGGGGGIIKEWNGFQYTYEGDSPGHGGGLNGYDANYNITNASVTGFGYSGYGATQTNGGLPGKPSGYYELNPETKGGFGYGGYADAYVEGISIYNHSSGGGSGYYGGGHGVHTNNAWTGGGGGSSFISGHNGCDAIAENSTEDNIVHTGQSNHYSGYVFTNTIMIDGAGYNWTTEKGSYTGMPTHDGASTMIGNSGNGYAKITFLSE